MRNYSLIALLMLVGCTSQQESASTTESVSMGSFVLDSLLVYDSEQALIDRFGQENLTRDTAWYPEGMGQYMITVLYPATKNEVSFTWADSSSYSVLDELVVAGDSAEWMSRGVRIGTPMSELVQLNGGDFTFSGFGWDYGGYAFWSDEGKLAGLTVILQSSEAMMSQDQLDSLTGDQQVSSRSTAARLNNPVVAVMKLTKERD